jgi:hypothetical protein
VANGTSKITFQWTKPIVFDCKFRGGTSLDVSPACPYSFPPTLLLNVLGQIAAFLGDNKKKDDFQRACTVNPP